MSTSYFIETASDRTRQLAVAAIIWLGLAAGAVFLFFFNPSSPSNQFFPQCPFRLVTGWQCPGCGSTRAFYQLLHLHPIAAFKFNPLMVLTLPFLVFVFLRFTRNAIRGKTERPLSIPPIYFWSWFALLLFFWVFRNTPWYPFVS
jgi:uncharacterized membrane protein YoaK (UPF0700 family)